MGDHCGFCVKVFCAKFRGIRTMSMGTYSGILGADEDKLKMHGLMVQITIQKMIEKGGKRKHLDWDAIQETWHQTDRHSLM